MLDLAADAEQVGIVARETEDVPSRGAGDVDRPAEQVPAERLRKPEWIRVKAGSPTTRFYEIKQILREHKLHTEIGRAHV